MGRWVVDFGESADVLEAVGDLLDGDEGEDAWVGLGCGCGEEMGKKVPRPSHR